MTNVSLPTDRATRWIFLSPHLDDAVFSCGGLISYLSGNGVSVEIWTVFSDQIEDPAGLTDYARSLHDRWQITDQSFSRRKNEDAAACKTVGARQVHFGFQDCIYRIMPDTGLPVVSSDAELFEGIKSGESSLIHNISVRLHKRQSESAIWVCPLGLGNHMDHLITRMAAEKTRSLMLYYADLPYALRMPVQFFPEMIQFSFDLPEMNVQQWGRAILQYSSQISTFWKKPEDMAAQYSTFLETYKGMPLWLSTPSDEAGA